MGVSKLYGQTLKGKNIDNIVANGLAKDYYVYAGKTVNAGDFVEFVNGVGSSTTTTSADTQIDTSRYSGYTFSAVLLNSTKVFITFVTDSTLYGVICEISGVNITVGTAVSFSSAVLPTTLDYEVSSIALSETKVFVTYPNDDSTSYCLYGLVCNISGTTITVGSHTQIVAYAYTGYSHSMELLDNGKIFIAHSYSSKHYLRGIVCTISGNTVSKGTNLSIEGSSNYANNVRTAKLDGNNVFIATTGGSSENLAYAICSISNATISITKAVSTLVSTSLSGIETSLVNLGNDKLLITHCSSSSYYLYGVVVNVSGNSITTGSDTQLSSVTYTGYQLSSVLTTTANKVFVSHCHTQSSYYLYGMICNVVGNEITYGTDTLLNDGSNAGYRGIKNLLIDDNVLVLHNLNSYNIYAQLWGIDKTNNKPTNKPTVKLYEKQVQKVTSKTNVYGIAKTTGTGGTSTGHRDKVSIIEASV